MKDEIKEILDKLNNKAEHYILYNYEVKLLLDYITNLQEKYERMKENAEILSNGYNELEKRIEKAIEYINKTSFYYKSHYGFKNDLLNILNGDDE